MKKCSYLICLMILLFSCNDDDSLITIEEDSPDNSSILITDRPTGIYVLSNGNSIGNIRDYDFVSGLTLRFNWGEFETSQGIYDFSVIDDAIAELQTIDKKLTLELLVFDPPQYVLDNSETWLFFSGSEMPLPWDSFALAAWDNLAVALANHLVPLEDGTMVSFSEHPTLETIATPIMGLSGIRELSGNLVNTDSYDRDLFLNGINQSVHSLRDVFPNKYAFMSAFGMDDDNLFEPLDEAIVDMLMTEFNNEGQLTLGLFQELLSDVGPTPDGVGRLLSLVSNDTYILFQALTSWTTPFTGENNVTSGNPTTGIELGFNNFGARYFELYLSDIDNQELWDDLRNWNEIIINE